MCSIELLWISFLLIKITDPKLISKNRLGIPFDLIFDPLMDIQLKFNSYTYHTSICHHSQGLRMNRFRQVQKTSYQKIDLSIN